MFVVRLKTLVFVSALLLISGLLLPAVFQTGPALADTWTPVATGGFGSGLNTRASSMALYNDGSGEKLYVGTWRTSGGCQVKRYDGSVWTSVGTGGLGNPDNEEAYCLAVYKSKLYAGTINKADGCEVRRYDGGSTWTQVNDDGFGLGVALDGALSMAVYDDGFGERLYVGTSWGPTVFHLYSYDGTSWATETVDAFTFPNNWSATCMAVYDDGSGEDLYIGTRNQTTGCEVISYDGTTAAQVGTLGLGNASNDWALTLAVFKGKLYVGTRTGIAPLTGGEVRRYDGAPAWTQVNQDGFGSGYANQEVSSLHVFKSRLYAGTLNYSGCLVYSTNGTGGAPFTWTLENANGFGDANQDGAREMVIYNNDLYVGTWNNSSATGCRVYMTRGPSITSVSPSSGRRGQTLDVSITGSNTSFTGGTSVAAFGSGITVNSTTVTDATHATANITISDNAATSARDVNVTTGSETPKALSGGFTVTEAATPTWFLAEGTTAWGFDCYITIENPNVEQLTADITYMTTAGEVDGGTIILPARSQTTVYPVQKLGEQDFSTKVECNEGKTIAVDRTMGWAPQQGAGAGLAGDKHCSIGVTAPARTWYLAEGSSAWGFECWHLIQNPSATTDANVTLTYMIEGAAPEVRTKTVPANSRATFNMEEEVGQVDASLKVESDIPVIPERSMYKDSRQEGHDSIGTTEPALNYYLAEGTTAWGFTTYVLIQNPQGSDTSVNVTYMTPSGAVPHPDNPIVMPADSRNTIRVNDYLPGSDFSTQVSGSQAIIAERAMYWGEGTEAGEACHDSIGMDAPHMTFYLPNGEAGSDVETWTLVQNPNASDVEVTITYLPNIGGTLVTFTETIPANSRKTFDMADSGVTGGASILVESNETGKPIMVERAMYWYHRGAGADTIGGYSD